jgi:hypothetical protein
MFARRRLEVLAGFAEDNVPVRAVLDVNLPLFAFEGIVARSTLHHKQIPLVAMVIRGPQLLSVFVSTLLQLHDDGAGEISREQRFASRVGSRHESLHQ